MRMLSFFTSLVVLVLFLSLTACEGSKATPTPNVVYVVVTNTPTLTATQPSPTPTRTVLPTRTHVPTYTPKPTKVIPPTETPSPLPVFTPQDFSGHPLAGIGTPFSKAGEVITEQNLGRLIELARWGKGVITDIAFSPDGKWLGVAASTGIYFYDTQSWAESFAFNYAKTVWSFAFSQDGKHFAVGFEDRIVQIVDIHSQKTLQTFQMERGPIEIVFVHNDRYLLSTSDYDLPEFWDLETNRPVNLSDLVGGMPNYVIPSVDGKTFVVLFGNEVRFWDLETGEFSQSYSNDYNYFSGVAKSSSYFVQSPWDGYFEVRRLDNGEITWSADASCQDCVEFFLPGEHSQNCEYGIYDVGPSSISNLQFSPDEKYLITHFLGRIQIRETSNGKLLRQMDANTDLAFSPNGLWMAWGATDGIVHIEQISNQQELETLVGFSTGVQNIKFEPGGNRIAIQSWDGFRIRAVNDGGLFRKFDVNDLDFSPDGNLIALGYQNGKVEIRNNSDLSLVRSLEYNPYPVSQIEFSSQGKWLVSVNDCMVYATNTTNWSNSYTINALMGPVSVLLSPNEDNLLLSRWYETELYQLSDGFLVDQSTLALYEDDNTIFAPDGNSVIKFIGGGLSIRDLLGNTIQDISVDWSSAGAGKFSPDGKLVAAVGWDGGIYIWRASDWQLLVTLQNSTDRSDSLAFSPDGLYIAIGSYNGTVSIWGIAP
ncbi:MAG TPA: hypothetical protein PK530_08595 [Anaerolineales bacterium]|nr:hypothetical protein [Anaerolineales bacterium]